ncbi:MAG: hypothetical protein Kapaf2KO_08320 [Candidatus Kapaibacteriales bacterium]
MNYSILNALKKAFMSIGIFSLSIGLYALDEADKTVDVEKKKVINPKAKISTDNLEKIILTNMIELSSNQIVKLRIDEYKDGKLVKSKMQPDDAIPNPKLRDNLSIHGNSKKSEIAIQIKNKESRVWTKLIYNGGSYTIPISGFVNAPYVTNIKADGLLIDSESLISELHCIEPKDGIELKEGMEVKPGDLQEVRYDIYIITKDLVE